MTEDLAPAKLGTTEYWESFYSKEIANFNSFGDEGEIWFGEDAEDKILEYLQDNFSKDERLSVLDLGTGNGHLLFTLLEAGFEKWTFKGVDYAEQSVALARQIAISRGMQDAVTFQKFDFLKDTWTDEEDSYDLILDKGTFDAISLSADTTASGERIGQSFPGRVANMLKPGGLFLITCCNWTTDELIQRLTTPSKKSAWFGLF
jgi:SAM-dependent methyltransferase